MNKLNKSDCVKLKQLIVIECYKNIPLKKKGHSRKVGELIFINCPIKLIHFNELNFLTQYLHI